MPPRGGPSGTAFQAAKRWPSAAESSSISPMSCSAGEQKCEPADKPGSVVGNHSSGIAVTSDLKQPTRKPAGRRCVPCGTLLPYLVLLRVGFTVPRRVATRAVRSYRTFSPLPGSLEARDLRRYIFCGTFRRLAPPRRYLAPCPPEPGLSSRVQARERLPGRLARGSIGVIRTLPVTSGLRRGEAHDQLDLGRHAELREDVLQVAAGRARADVQLVRGVIAGTPS